MQLYPFDLAFMPDGMGRPFFASFPFMFGGAPVPGISCGLSSRFAGNMVYSEQNPARLALFSALGLDPQRVYGLKQIHSRDVLAVDRQNLPAVPAANLETKTEHKPQVCADGLVSCDREIALSATVADCLPVYLFDTESGAFGLVHSGWKGTGIALRALELMRERWHTKAEAVAAVLGPCIDSCCYRVDAERAAVFEKEFGAVTRRLDDAQGTSWYLDLKAANVRLLAGAGVRNIAVCGGCTFTDERLGSFRREGADYTRMAALVYRPQGTASQI
jgi:YfiH family protein